MVERQISSSSPQHHHHHNPQHQHLQPQQLLKKPEQFPDEDPTTPPQHYIVAPPPNEKLSDEEDDEVYDDGKLREALVVLNWNTEALEHKKQSKQVLIDFITGSCARPSASSASSSTFDSSGRTGIPVKGSDNMFVFGSEDEIFQCFQAMKRQFPWIWDSRSKVMDPIIVRAPKAGHFEYADPLL